MSANTRFYSSIMLLAVCVMLPAGCVNVTIPVSPTATFSKFLPPTWTPTVPVSTKTSATPTSTPSTTSTSSSYLTGLHPGMFVVYQQGNTVYASDITTGKEILLGEYPTDALIIPSPNGHMVTYMENGSLYTQDIIHSKNDPIPMPAHSVDQNLWNGSWSPDGMYLAFAIDQVLVNADPPSVDEFPSIFLYGVPHNEYAQVTLWNTVESSPVWSPDGNWLAFLSDHAKTNAAGPGSFVGATDIFVLSSKCLQQLASCKNSFFKPLTTTGTAGDAIAPAWQPNGEKIGFIYIDAQTGDKDVYIVDLSGNLQNLTGTAGAWEESFSWSPDGSRMILKRTIPGYGSDLYILNMVDYAAINITFSPAIEEGNPTWSLDGKEIAFKQNVNDENSTIVIFSLKDNQPRTLANSNQSKFLFWLNVFPEISEGMTVLVSPAGENLNIRAEPSTDSTILKKLQPGDQITVLESSTVEGKTWWKIQHQNVEGWVVQNYDWYLPSANSLP